ncbi:MAG: Fe(3+) ABC transporter substrate-binding protein [Alphaproteobacteria bacterium]|nr:Fe(3+) ABC transporter substrate-binding protein [Alphaproteobacteria bacterium]
MNTVFVRRFLSKSALLIAATATMSVSALGADEVNVYSYRQPYLVKPLFDGFTAATGIKVNVIFAKKGLIERMAQEGNKSPADVLLTVDIGRLTGAKAKGVTQTLNSGPVNANIPANYRDPEGHWFGLTTRARVAYASKERVAQNSITYEELADPKWRGKICVRSGKHVYNVAMIASMIKHHGEAKTKEWLQGFKANLARKPAGNDRAQVKGVFSGQCDLAIGNTYYMAKMQLNEKKPEQKEWAASVKMLFPNSAERGTHVNISGASLAKFAPHKANGVKLIEFLAGEKAQKIYAEVNHEYPVKAGVAASELVQSWGKFKSDPTSLEDIATLRKRATEMVDEVAFDDGPSS